jgi:hypothetical protein
MKFLRCSLPAVMALLFAAAPVAAQQRPALAPAARAFVSVDAPVVALTHVRLVDGTGAPARQDQTVVVRGTRIERVGPAATTSIPAGARVIDLSGHTVIPALQHGFITASEYVPGKRPDVCPPGNQRAQADVDVASPAVQESIRRIAATGTPVVSTLGVYESFIPGRARLDSAAMSMLAPSTRREVEANHLGLAQSGFTVSERLLQKMMRWERDFVAAGGLLGAGSDPWGTGFLPGFGNLRNYELLVEAGFTPEQAIQVMTLNGARILGEEARIGSVEPGKAADLVIIRGDPVGSPAAIYEVTTVFRDGRGYDSARLREFARGKVGVF